MTLSANTKPQAGISITSMVNISDYSKYLPYLLPVRMTGGVKVAII